MKKQAVIECDPKSDLYVTIVSTLQLKLAGQTVFYADHLGDLVGRHCPELYDIADQAGFRFVPSSDKHDLMKKPPDIRFDIIRKTALN